MEAPRHIGIDLHRNRFTCCLRLENGRKYLSEWKVEDLPRFVKKLRPNDEIAVEVTGNTRLFYDAVAPYVRRVAAVDPNQFQVISHSVKKTDPNDARNLALYLEKDLLPEVRVRMKDKTQAQLASMMQTRDTLVKLRTSLKNKVNNILSAHGINLEKEALSSQKQLQEILVLQFDPMVKLELEVIIEEMRSLNQRIAKLEKAIADEGSKLEGHKNLTSIKGIGPLSGSILLSVIGDIDDFEDEGKLAVYFGIVPRIPHSNETEASWRRWTENDAAAQRCTGKETIAKAIWPFQTVSAMIHGWLGCGLRAAQKTLYHAGLNNDVIASERSTLGYLSAVGIEVNACPPKRRPSTATEPEVTLNSADPRFPATTFRPGRSRKRTATFVCAASARDAVPITCPRASRTVTLTLLSTTLGLTIATPVTNEVSSQIRVLFDVSRTSGTTAS